jgi:hypothetical protein
MNDCGQNKLASFPCKIFHADPIFAAKLGLIAQRKKFYNIDSKGMMYYETFYGCN